MRRSGPRGAWSARADPYSAPVDTGRALERLAARAMRLSDSFLDFLVLAFGAWTVVYHACLVLGVGAAGAVIATVAAAVPCAWLALSRPSTAPAAPEPPVAPSWASSRLTLVLGGYALAVAVSAAAFAFTSAPWAAVWAFLLVAAGGGALLVYLRVDGRLRLDLSGDDEPAPLVWPGALVMLAWAVGLAVLSLYLVRPDSDDTQYVRLTTWIADHGEFPLRDVLFSDQVFEAVFYPPLSSFEALVGTVARFGGVSGASATYYLVPPLASALGVLALWRLLRIWRVRVVGLALSTALVFLLMAAQEHRTLGNLFIGRIWQGKVVFLVVLVPLLFVLLHEYVERPTRRQLVLLAAAGAAGVGLTSTGSFLVPVLAAGCLAPFALRAPKTAALGFAAAATYPLGALVVSAALGGRRAGGDLASDVVADEIARFVIGDGLFAFIALAAALMAPLLIRSRRGALMAAGTLLLVVLLFAPPVPSLVWELTGIGRVLWRVAWVVPFAALVGVVATAAPAGVRHPALRALPALLLCGVLVAWGTPVWSNGTLEDEPSWKRFPIQVEEARRIVDRAEPGDVILAPVQVSQTILVMSSDVTTVSPRPFYVLPLEDEPAAHADERLLLQAALEPDVGGDIEGWPEEPPSAPEVARALEEVGVDIACANNRGAGSSLLAEAGYVRSFRAKRLTCFVPPGPG
jgi:hypothetical protein